MAGGGAVVTVAWGRDGDTHPKAEDALGRMSRGAQESWGGRLGGGKMGKVRGRRAAVLSGSRRRRGEDRTGLGCAGHGHGGMASV